MSQAKTAERTEGLTAADLLLALSQGRSAAELAAKYREQAARNRELHRRVFDEFGIAASAACPASVLYHGHSRITPDWECPMTMDEIARLTMDLNYKTYPEAARAGLPESSSVPVPLETAIRRRRTAGGFSPAGMTFAEVAAMLRNSCGVTENGRLPLRAAPSPGGLYPTECYLLAYRVEGLEPAVWHFSPLSGELERVRALGGVESLWPALPPGWHGETPAAVFVLSARLPRVQAKYGERGYRFALIECGHIAQNLLLVAAALGVAAVSVGGFYDDAMNSLTGIDGGQEPALYAILAGR